MTGDQIYDLIKFGIGGVVIAAVIIAWLYFGTKG